MCSPASSRTRSAMPRSRPGCWRAATGSSGEEHDVNVQRPTFNVQHATKLVLAVMAAVAVVTLAVHWPSVHNGFVNWDDVAYLELVSQHPHLSSGHRSLGVQRDGVLLSSAHVVVARRGLSGMGHESVWPPRDECGLARHQRRAGGAARLVAWRAVRARTVSPSVWRWRWAWD